MGDRRIVRADARAGSMRHQIGTELHDARLVTRLSLAAVGNAIGISPSEASRIERGRADWVSVATLSRYASVVGLDLWVRAYPGGEPLRDIAHVRLIDSFQPLLGAGLMVRAEVPIGDARDLRAWDMTLTDRRADTCGVEFETRWVDAQAQLRRINRKIADGGLDRALLVIADTRANRIAVRAAAGLLATTFSIQDRAALDALKDGRIPARNAMILLPIARHAQASVPPHGKG